MERQDKIALQGLLASRGWELYKARVLEQEGIPHQQSLHSQLQDKLNAAARASEWDKVSYYTGQLDLIPVMLKLPEEMYRRA